MHRQFSHLDKPLTKPYAIGEDQRYVPAMSLLSGPAALDSLTDYYPSSRMDSQLDPRKYQQTPQTKVAALRAAYVTNRLNQLQPENSTFVTGFLAKCAEASLTHDALLVLIERAVAMHPGVADEFQKCGFVKQALGPTMPPAGSISPLIPKPKPFSPTPPTGVGFAAQRPPKFKPPTYPTQMLDAAKLPKPPVPEKPPAPATPQAAPAVSSSAPPAGNMFGRTLRNFKNITTGGATAVAGGLGTVLGGVGSAGARVSDGLGVTRNATPIADAFTGSMATSAMSGFNNGVAGLTGRSPAAMAQRFKEMGITGAKPLDQLKQDHIRQLHDSTGVDLPGISLKPSQAAGAYTTLSNTGHEAAQMVPTAVAGRAMKHTLVPKAILSYQAMNSTPLAAGVSAADAAVDTHNLSDFAKSTVEGLPSYQEGAKHPDAIAGWSHRDRDTKEMQVILNDGRMVPESQVDLAAGRGQPPVTANPAEQGGQPAVQDQSPVTANPDYEAIAGMVDTDPEQAKQLAATATTQLTKVLKTPDGKLEADHVKNQGSLSPTGQEKAINALTSEGYDWAVAKQKVGAMDGWEQLGLWGGLGMAGVGLLHALSGGGGVGSIIMALLGLGTAGFTAGKAGLLDQGSQDLTRGLSDAVMGGDVAVPDYIKNTLPTMLDAAAYDAPSALGAIGTAYNDTRDAGLQELLKQVATSSPQIAQQLDRAAGTGSWGNAALSQFGDITGMRQNMMQNKLNLNPTQQDKLLSLWTKMRETQ